ncbi:putative membrane protein YkvI [Anoxybacillus vitaminiphilus]|uniref:Putative membrane protein YkvI n=1 Tax=Paranoxybacillus vitaminiphilus TaxID=581036 RepID=A0A327YRF8_9BACL|nr:putative membrane protein YkvI [Anoxybacillus vitaminiphilus]
MSKLAITKWSGAIQVAAVYVGTVVGAGFATGKEIVEFFTQYGPFGLLGILISGFLFIWLGMRMMLIASRIKASSYKELNDYLFGKTISSVVTFVMMLIALGTASVMLSGAGAVFEEQLGISKQLGVFATILLTFVVMLFGLKGLFSVNVVIVPMLLLFSLSTSAIALFDLEITDAIVYPSSFKWVLSPFAYVAFNLAMAQMVLVPLASEIQDEQIVKRGSVLGGILLFIVLVSSHISLSVLPDVLKYDIPMAEVVKTFFISFYWLYIVVIYGEIFTSLIGGIFGLQRQLHSYFSISNIVLLFVLLLIVYVISLVDYSSLLSFLYPLFGYISILFLIFLVCCKIP